MSGVAQAGDMLKLQEQLDDAKERLQAMEKEKEMWSVEKEELMRRCDDQVLAKREEEHRQEKDTLEKQKDKMKDLYQNCLS